MINVEIRTHDLNNFFHLLVDCYAKNSTPVRNQGIHTVAYNSMKRNSGSFKPESLASGDGIEFNWSDLETSNSAVPVRVCIYKYFDAR